MEWLTDPSPQSAVLPLRGALGSGKSAVLHRVHERRQASIYLDCRGITAEEAALRILSELGLDIARARGRYPLSDALAKLRTNTVVLLANVQWAGELFSSTEPRQIAGPLVTELAVQSRGRLRVVIEADEPHGRVATDRAGSIVLDPEPEDGAALGADTDAGLAQTVADHTQLRALAAAELREIPLSVWGFLVESLGGRRSEEELRRSLDLLPRLLASGSSPDGELLVRFRSDAQKQLVRTAAPCTPAEQRSMAQALLATVAGQREPAADPAADTAAVVSYAEQALAVHAALGGSLPQLIDDESTLVVHSARRSLLQGISLAWPDGVPLGGTAADAHYLDVSGVAPVSRAEWLAWLHWAAVNRGRDAWAAELSAGDVDLPWRTVWSRWRPYGVFGPRTEDVGAVDYVEIGHYGDTPVTVTQQELPPYDDTGTTDGSDSEDSEDFADFAGSEDSEDLAPDERHLERVWRLSDGEELTEPSVVHVFLDDDGEVDRTIGSRVSLDEDIAPASVADRLRPRLPKSVTGKEYAGAARWVANGAGGVFALDVLRPAELSENPPGWPAPLVPPLRRTEVWPRPDAVAEGGPALASWLAAVFAPDALRRVSPDALPDGLTDAGARTALTEVGFPRLGGDRPAFLSTVAVDEGLEPVGGPGRTDSAYLLGSWLGEPVLLDGGSGRVLLSSVAGKDLLGENLAEFTTLVALYRALRLSSFPTRAEERDARRSVKAWALEIAPEAAASRSWQAALDGDLDVPESL
ncbi:SUKH-4 family immunity protein [Streptomyces cavernicola]|uniref:SUKH-4 family immunity protein n=1 Tax=Streptomyces cavernicola TaxID=3043613 RepID=A0ABT6SH40_9ACTN|nr:SUKH-4 family immunity protein [Streptomyces sp. B-S-A6]MDI3407179.1 SUKH-4 family immunity protein [Streptomyces sp. B-S-A6]